MQNLIEIKSMSKEAAVQRALKILDATPEQVVSVEEKVKSRSFLGLFNKEGVYVVTVDKTLREKKIVPESIVAEKTEIKTEIKKEIETVAINTKKEIQEEKKIEIPKKEISKKQAKIDKEAIILEKTRELLKHMDLNLDAEIAAREGKFYVVNLFGDDNGIIIGKKEKL
ncbi:MAG: hypothetical protein ACRCWN_00715 [Fusobacteriaceae bacterium]